MITQYKIFENRSSRIQDLYNRVLDSKLDIPFLKDNKDIVSDIFGGGFNILQLLILYRYDDKIKLEALKYIDIDEQILGGTILSGSKHISTRGMTALFVASVRGFMSDVDLLLVVGADCNIIDSHGKYFFDYIKNGENWFSEKYPEKYFEFLKQKNVKMFNL
jgi:hypothetical protein